MSGFSAGDAAVFGFSFVKRAPMVLLASAGIFAALYWWYFQSIFGALQHLTVAMEPSASPEEQMQAMTAYFASVFSLAYVALIVFTVVLQGVILRTLVRGAPGGWLLGLQLGMDELRLAIINIVVYIAAFVPFVVGYGLVIIGVVSAAGGLAAGGEPSGFAAVMALVGSVAMIVGGVVSIWLGLRLSPAAATTIGESRMTFVGAWRMTKGRAWSLFGAHLLAYLIMIGIALAAMIVAGVIAGVAFSASGVGAELAQGGEPSPEAVFAVFTSPWMIIPFGVFALAYLPGIAAWTGIGAYAYRTLGPAAGYHGGAARE